MQITRTTFTFGVSAIATNVNDDGTQAVDPLSASITDSLTNGTAAAQANQQWHDRRTLAVSASETLALTGALTDAFGVTVDLARVKGMLVTNTSQTGSLTMGGGSNYWAGPWGSGTYTIPPGGSFQFDAPIDATGFAVTGGTAMNLKVLNNDSVNALTYVIRVVGATA